MENRILIVEDEIKIAQSLKKGLTENDYIVDLAYEGMSAKTQIESTVYNLVILDINIPLINGYEICKMIREKGIQVPILMLTALNSIDNKLKGFDTGADDYLSKPFEFKELLARIKALLKRGIIQNIQTEHILIISDLEFNIESKEVRRNKRKITLTAKELQLLEFFMRNKNKVLSRADIAKKVWDIDFDTQTNVIDVYVSYLRNKIDKDQDIKLIHTQVGLGYILKDPSA